jgi:hypothetical protein
MKRIIILFLCLALLIVPAFGQTVQEDAPAGEGITSVLIKSDVGTSGTITFDFNNGTSISGSWSYLETGSYFDYIVIKEGTVNIGSDSDSAWYVLPSGNFYTYVTLPGHDFNYYNFTGNKVVMQGGQYENIYDIIARTDAPYTYVIRMTFTSDADVTYEIETAKISTMNYNLGQTLIDEGDDWWVTKIMILAYKAFDYVFSFSSDLLYWLNFFFVENLMMIVALFLAVPMAFAAKNSRGNPQKFLKEYFKTLKGFFDFMFFVWRMLIESIGTIRGWFRL